MYFVKKSLVFLLILSLFVSQFSFLIPSVYAASSPWTQTDWVGGGGQTSWSDTTKFDSSSSVTTSTAGQVTLTATSSWYNTSWAYRRKITFDNSAQAENLANFPILVKLDSTRINYSNTQDSGQDIRFTDSDGTTLLSYEIEKWDETGNSFVWVKVPQIDASSSTDYIYMYYGNSSATDGQAATSVWNSNYLLVQHLKETSGTTTSDSTSNSNNGTKLSATEPNPTTSGQINGAQDFDGADDVVRVSDSDLWTFSGDFTISAWVSADVISGARVIVGHNYVSPNRGWILYFNSDNTLHWGFSTDGVVSSDTGRSWSPSTGTWYHVVARRSGNSVQLYVDGSALGATISMTSAPYNSTGNLYIGDEGSTVSEWDGLIDEVRISNSARSAAWVAASYKSEADTFNTFASEEPQVQTSGTLTSSIFDTEFSAGAAWGTLTYTATAPTNTSVSVKARTSNSASMTGATAFSSCTAITSGSDISSNSCVTDTHRYIQYQLSLANTNSISTPTFQDVSTAFAAYDAIGPTLSLDSPGDNSYTNSERPTFKWKAATDAIGTISDYDLVIDNPSAGSGQVSGDFTISDIPVSRTTDYETNKYVVRYDGFSDSDTGNDYISVYTKSHSDWGSSELDGKLREGKVSWKVKATDSNGNSTETSRTLFIDRTNPNVEFTQVNSTPYTSSTISTTDRTPTIFGKITDSLTGGDSSNPPAGGQDENGPKIASGPKQVDITVEKKTGLTYKLVTLYKITMGNPYWTCTNKEITDNSKQKCDPTSQSYAGQGKYLPFEYTPEQNLDLGTYKITISGKDKADNSASETSFTLNITTLAKITTPEEKKIIEEEIKPLKPEHKEKIKEELEITKPTEPVKPSALEKTVDTLTAFRDNLFNATVRLAKNIAGGVGKGVQVAFNGIGQGAKFVVDATSNIGKTTSNTFVAMYNGTRSILAYAGQGVGNGANAVGQSIAFIGEKASQGISTVAKGTGNLLALIGQGIGATGKTIGEGYNQLANNAPGVTKTILTGIGDGVSTTASTTVSIVRTVSLTTVTIAQNTASTIGNATHTIATTTSTAAQNTGTFIAGIANNVRATTASIAQNTTKTIGNITNSIASTTSTIAKNTGSAIADPTQKAINITKEGIRNLAFKVGEKTQDFSETAGFALVKFGYLFVNEPTKIADVQVAVLSPTSVKISWKTNHPANGKVNYGLDKTYPLDMQSEKRITRHEFTLSNLKPDTQYYFEVMSHNKNYVYDANREFKTPAVASVQKEK